ncbi:MAG: hypothetical protein WD314_14525 [Trueperaceae bacterium]
MRDTPVPESHLEVERLRVAAALQRARRALVARPRASAIDLAQAAVFPLLHSLAVDIFDLQTMRLAGEPARERADYRLLNGAESVLVTVFAVETPVTGVGREGAEHAWTLASNGRVWRAATADDARNLEFDLFDEGFAEVLHLLLAEGTEPSERFDRAKEALRDGRTGRGRPAEDRMQARHEGAEGSRGTAGESVTLQRIAMGEVQSIAEQVRHLHGKLEARFDGQSVEVTSRSAFYFVLAALALQHGRAEAIPADDLIQPPDEPPPSRRARALGRPGWHLLLDHQPAVLEERTAALLDALNLRTTFTATQRGEPYPAPG